MYEFLYTHNQKQTVIKEQSVILIPQYYVIVNDTGFLTSSTRGSIILTSHVVSGISISFFCSHITDNLKEGYDASDIRRGDDSSKT